MVPSGGGHSPSKEGTRVYLNCEGKLDQVLSRVEGSGGKIIQPKFSIGDQGWIAVIEDTEGNIVGLYRSQINYLKSLAPLAHLLKDIFKRLSSSS